MIFLLMAPPSPIVHGVGGGPVPMWFAITTITVVVLLAGLGAFVLWKQDRDLSAEEEK